MALTNDQKITIHTLLGVGYGNCALLNTILNTLKQEQETAITSILTQYSSYQYDFDKIKADGLDANPERAIAGLRKQMRTVLNYQNSGSGMYRIGRG